jgi:hypothetical protein
VSESKFIIDVTRESVIRGKAHLQIVVIANTAAEATLKAQEHFANGDFDGMPWHDLPGSEKTYGGEAFGVPLHVAPDDLVSAESARDIQQLQMDILRLKQFDGRPIE